MKAHRIIAIFAAASLAVPTYSAVAESKSQHRIVGYLPDWNYRPFSNLDLSQLTHINIAFCNPDENGTIYCDIPEDELKSIIAKAHSHDVEVFAALGGGGGCDGYLQHLDTPEEREAFNTNIMDYCDSYAFDGIDLDIELGSSNNIWNYYGDWCAELRTLCDTRDMKMSTATAQWVAEKVSPETFALFDFVNVMAYDNDEDKYSHASYEYSVECLDYFSQKKKIPSEKLVLGVPFYGRGYTSDGELDWNSYMSFGDIVSKGSEYYSADKYNGITYNGAETIAKKAELAKNYGGIMIWELTQDAKGEKSLLKVINDTLGNGTAVAGDVNSDGSFNVSDLVLLQMWLLAKPDTELKNWQAGDLCKDDWLDVFDLCAMRKKLIE
ncbi:glycosyl hydrolase family 18 protein [Ruminococcus sp.]|uniref:glycosyl hydrolase family 18 protein n=1 Tax=Ruminococcus sp. TaxID=41978 RepID=UPI0025F687F2|nr:glycosyl hydrolase family 18 protein [Ruminococcus sp.]